MSGGRAHKVVERKHAAAVELNETWLDTFSAPVLEIGLDRLDVALEVVHMAVRRVLTVRLCHRFRLSPCRPNMARAGCAVQPASPVTFLMASTRRSNNFSMVDIGQLLNVCFRGVEEP